MVNFAKNPEREVLLCNSGVKNLHPYLIAQVIPCIFGADNSLYVVRRDLKERKKRIKEKKSQRKKKETKKMKEKKILTKN